MFCGESRHDSVAPTSRRCGDRRAERKTPGAVRRGFWPSAREAQSVDVETGQRPGLLLANAVQFVGAKAERSQDRRSDLPGLDLFIDDTVRELGIRHQQRDTAIVGGEPAVLGELGAAGVDQAGGGDGDEVRRAAVVERAAETRGELIRVPELDDAELGGMGVEIRPRRRVVLMLRSRSKPHQADVVGGVLRDAGRLAIGRIIDGLAQRDVDGRLAVLGRNDDQRLAIALRELQRRDHCADLGIDEVEAGLKAAVRRRARGIGIAADQAGIERIAGVALGELLADADGLEVHAEDRRHTHLGGPGAVEARDLVEHRLHLQHVVALDAVEARGGVLAGHAVVGIDFGREQVLDASAGRTIDEIVRRVLVRPCGAAAMGADHFEDGVGLDELMRIHRHASAVDQRHRQFRRIDLRQRLAERAAPGVAQLIVVDALVEQHVDARFAGAIRARREQRAVERIVVIDAGRFRRAAGHLGNKPRKRIGGARCQCLRIGETMARKVRKIALRVLADIIGEIDGV